MALRQLEIGLVFALGITVAAGAVIGRSCPANTTTTTPAKATCPDGVNTATNTACCPLYAVRDDLNRGLFQGGQCNEEASESLRLTFHDAIGISSSLTASGQWGGGGADGSIVIFADVETAFEANNGIDEIINEQEPYLLRSNMSVADFVQFAGAVGTANCPGAPRLSVYIGRKDATQASPNWLTPEPSYTVDTILNRFMDAGNITADEVVYLLASHSIAFQSKIDPTVPYTPLDSTPNVFDTQFYVETQLTGITWAGNTSVLGESMSPIPGEFRLQSDYAFARDPRTACEWQSMVDNQTKMQQMFAAAYTKMSLLGQNVDDLIDCSEVITSLTSNTVLPAFLPAGKTAEDIDQACPDTAYPSLTVQPGPAISIPPIQTA